MHLPLRENGEVMAGAYIIRNDRRGACFLLFWLSNHPPTPPESTMKDSFIDIPNSDNGALVTALGMLIVAASASRYAYYMRNSVK